MDIAARTPLTDPAQTLRGGASTWRPLHFLNVYRAILAGLFVVLIYSGTGPSVLGSQDPELFKVASLSYLAFSLATSFLIRWRWVAFEHQVYVQTLIDIMAIMLLTYASGGLGSGLGMLLVVAIAGGSLLMAGRMAILFAAIAAIAVLIEETYSLLHFRHTATSLTHAGVLGTAIFATAVLAHVLARRIRESEALAVQRGFDLANMEQLNDYIIQHMQTGIVVTDPASKVRLINQSAWQLLGMPPDPEGKPLTSVSKALAEQLSGWRADPDVKPGAFRTTVTSPSVQPGFAELGPGGSSGSLIFLEDTAGARQRAQQMKLASLATLAAGIAHEIRNPLGAISHASQLLAESPGLDPADNRFTQIILENSRRTNRIVESILSLSRRDRARPEILDLRAWLLEFMEEFTRTRDIASTDIAVNVSPTDVYVRMDQTQLHQVLWNLCENALRYSTAREGSPRVALSGGTSPESLTPYLDVINFGSTITPETVERLFEPFFTTERTGTGLGLYVARELCEANQARLDYLPVQADGSCFRITFADPRRKQVA